LEQKGAAGIRASAAFFKNQELRCGE